MKTKYAIKIEENNLIRFLPNVNMSDRDKDIVAAHILSNITYTKLGKMHNISSSRVAQILKRYIARASYCKRKEEREKVSK